MGEGVRTVCMGLFKQPILTLMFTATLTLAATLAATPTATLTLTATLTATLTRTRTHHPPRLPPPPQRVRQQRLKERYEAAQTHLDRLQRRNQAGRGRPMTVTRLGGMGLEEMDGGSPVEDWNAQGVVYTPRGSEGAWGGGIL